MTSTIATDEALLAERDAASFEEFYNRHVENVLAFFSRRTRDAELAADLTAETFAAALAGRRRFRPEAGAASAWLFGIAMHKLTDAQRRGRAERRARKRLGMERIELYDEDIARIEALGESVSASALLEVLRVDQRSAIRAHVLEERSYAEIARQEHVSEAVVRKRRQPRARRSARGWEATVSDEVGGGVRMSRKSSVERPARRRLGLGEAFAGRLRVARKSSGECEVRRGARHA
jgi:RNA polymerase sigma-70 factor (ECF subfamily)